MVVKPTFGKWLSIETLEELENPFIFTLNEPWQLISPNISRDYILDYNFNMNLNHLENLYQRLKDRIDGCSSIIGIGGGTSCDTAKYFSWRLKEEKKDKDLILIPSIISVDAFLCSSIAVRENNKVVYIGDSEPLKIIIDYELIQKAPKYLNRAGISDTLSITSALGDWKLARDENNERFDQNVFQRAKTIAKTLMSYRNHIRDVDEEGIKALVDGFYNEVFLCEEYGNARPEEGSEHFLAYCLESVTGQHYIHGNLIGMNILISLLLQNEYAEFSMEEIRQFLNDIKLKWTLNDQNIGEQSLRKALKSIKSYVRSEKLFYSIYDSPKLDIEPKMINNILKIIK